MTDEERIFSRSGKAVDDALAAIETIGKAGETFRPPSRSGSAPKSQGERLPGP